MLNNSPTATPERGDAFGRALTPWLSGEKVLQSGPPLHLPADWWMAGGEGATTNHDEQSLALWAAQHLDSVKDLIIAWYGKGIEIYGDQRREALWSKSHGAHYLSARGPILLFGMRARNPRVIEIMTRTWKRDLASIRLLRNPAGEVICPGARFTGEADQRAEVNLTFKFLEVLGGPREKTIHLPNTLKTAPTWLGLYSLTLINDAFKAREPWAAAWPQILREILSAKPEDRPPVAGGLIVERSRKGHLARFDSTDGMLRPAAWALADYSTQRAEYGLPGQPVPPLPGGPVESYRFPKPTGGRP